jgi:hypothetical protein
MEPLQSPPGPWVELGCVRFADFPDLECKPWLVYPCQLRLKAECSTVALPGTADCRNFIIKDYAAFAPTSFPFDFGHLVPTDNFVAVDIIILTPKRSNCIRRERRERHRALEGWSRTLIQNPDGR